MEANTWIRSYSESESISHARNGAGRVSVCQKPATLMQPISGKSNQEQKFQVYKYLFCCVKH